MKHVWSVFCEKSTIDQDSNNISLIDVVEQINVSAPLEELTKASGSEEPAVVQFKADLVTLWVRSEGVGEEEDLNFKVEFFDAEGKKVQSQEGTAKVPSKSKRMRTRMTIEGFKVSGPGIYKIKMHYKDGDEFRKVAEIPVEVTFREK